MGRAEPLVEAPGDLRQRGSDAMGDRLEVLAVRLVEAHPAAGVGGESKEIHTRDFTRSLRPTGDDGAIG